MLAHRVVLKRGLKIEPEAWLASIDEADFYNWEAYYRLEPWGNEEALLARACNLISALLAAKLGTDCVVPTQDFLPVDWAWRQEQKTADNLAAAEMQMAERFA